ncbi:P-loop containing nucleoside triphosphate hydrolase protein [Tribonema minus]|uniref:P-loop containing nucleoside triphosphate hydrolase protein n=1 Tax=Tribonema minus TaxID=303371 RepID=A0A835ZBT7_9STRA|nr:P-loop containing nucleoside triphosphate hydrolase protein [Tribonema minus]
MASAEEGREWATIEHAAAKTRAEDMNQPIEDRFHGDASKLETLLNQAGAYSQFLLQEEEKVQQQPLTATAAGAPEPVQAKTAGKKRSSPHPGKKPKQAKLAQSKKSMDEAAGKMAQERVHAASDPYGFKQPKLMTGGTLKDFQLEGVRWLINLFQNGKSNNVIGLLAALREMNVAGPFIICAPLATLPNWVSEIKRWCPAISCILYHGSKADREEVRKGPLNAAKATDINFPVVVTSYDICIIDRPHLQRYPWKYLVVDEGQRIKKKDCRLVRELKLLPSESRLLLTGTPIQNTLEELWSLLNFVNPGLFDDLLVFRSWFRFGTIGKDVTVDKIISEEQQAKVVTRLHEILRPFLLRRLKRDVLQVEIPPKCEIVVYAGMTRLQRTYYSLVETGTLRETLLELGIEGAAEISQINISMNLRKVCQHPYLFGEPRDKSGEYVGTTNPETLVAASGKLALLDRLLTKLRKQGHKVLVFSQMTSMLSILEDYVRHRRWGYCRIDGSSPLAGRQASIDAFNAGAMEEDLVIFLLSTRAGGLGINLAAADTVILYDSDWNPHQDTQAQDRCHRIGQQHPVVVYRLLTMASVEIEMMEKQMSKKKLERMAIAGGDFRKVGRRSRGALTPQALRRLLADEIANLRQRAEAGPETAAVNAQSTTEGAISEDELDVIMDRQRIFGDYAVYSNRSGVPPTEGDLIPKEGHMYDFVDPSIDFMLDNKLPE